MELDPKDFNFGEVWQNAPAEREFTVKNTGAAPLTLSAKSSCGCTVATQPRSPLGPGETTTFKITYSTVAAGAAHKTVTLTTNDPAQPTAVINVQGSVKAFITATPSERIFFQNLETNSKESQTIRLESKYDSPVHLQVREGQSFGIFEVALKEIEPGRVFELTATTKPPLPPNNSAATVILETGLEKLPTYNVFLNANVPPRVLVTPPSLSVPATTTQPMEQMVRVQHRLGSPLSITDIKASLESIRWEILPEVEPSAGLKVAMIPIRLKLPVWDDLPIGGATVEIYTDDPEPQFQKLEVRIFKPPRPPLPATRPAISPSVRPPTTRPVPASRPVPLPPQPAAPTSRPT